MPDAQLIGFADQYLGIAIPLGMERTKIIQRIINAASAIRDGT